MKKLYLASVAAVALVTCGAASAADLRPVYKAPPMAEVVLNWTGFYIGANVGYSWGRGESTLLPASIFALPINQKVNGFVGGGQAGYNWQINRTWVVGLEADIQGTGERGRTDANIASVLSLGCLGDCTLLTTFTGTATTSMPWFATFRGRVGTLVEPQWLIYVTGGLAVGEIKYETQITGTVQQIRPAVLPATTVVGPLMAESQTRLGWALGAGTEKKLSRNWSAKLEYLYVDFGSKTYLSSFGAGTNVGFHDHILRAGVNYAFDAGPVIARY